MTSYQDLSETEKNHHRRRQRARQRALLDLQMLYPRDFALLLEAHLQEVTATEPEPRQEGS